MVVGWTKYEMVEIGIFSKGWGEGGFGGLEGNRWAKYAQQYPAQLDLTPTLMFLLASSWTLNENASKHLTVLNYLHLKCFECFES